MPNKYMNKLHSKKALSKRKKKQIANDIIEGITSNPIGQLFLFKTYLEFHNNNNNKTDGSNDKNKD